MTDSRELVARLLDRPEDELRGTAFAIAEQLSDIGDALTGQRVTAWGPIRDETFRPSGAKRDVTYQVLQLERMAGPFGTLPKVSPLRDPEQEVVDAIPVAEGQEALFDAAESARIDAEEASKT